MVDDDATLAHDARLPSMMNGELVIAGGDATEVLELAEKALDLVALAVEGLAEAGLPFAVGLGGYIGHRALDLDQVADAVCIISLAGEHDRARLKAVEQVVSGRSVVRLARCQAEPDRETLPINDRVDLGRETAPLASLLEAAGDCCWGRRDQAWK